jgi:hypothetical protein
MLEPFTRIIFIRVSQNMDIVNVKSPWKKQLDKTSGNASYKYFCKDLVSGNFHLHLLLQYSGPFVTTDNSVRLGKHSTACTNCI